MKLSSYSVALWLATAANTVTAANTKTNAGLLLRRALQDNKEEVALAELWGVQSGSANAHSDAGGMVYDPARDEIILTGTTHDNQFFADDGAAGVDCFVASVPLPDPTTELSASQLADTNAIVGMMAASHERGLWKFGAKHRMTTTNDLDRCDLIVRMNANVTDGATSHAHTFVGGTLAVATNDNNIATSVEPLLYEASITAEGGSAQSTIVTSEPFKVFEADEVSSGTVQPKKNDLIIPAIMTAHHHQLYVATIHRLLVVTEASSNASPSMRIALGLTKFTVTDTTSTPLKQEWARTFSTSILEVKGGTTPALTSAMFHGGPGNVPMTLQEQEMEEEINEIENEEEMHFDMHRHEYKNDGVLISGLEVIDVDEDETEPFLLIAGSAPGTKESRVGPEANHTMSMHPFMDTAHTMVGDWDGYVAKINLRTGEVLKPVDAGTMNLVQNTWSYRLQSQPKRNDFVQSICVPRFPPGTLSDVDYHPAVAYVIGTTEGIIEGDKNGGAFIQQLDLGTMNILWQKQISGSNVHGMACEVLVDVASHGTLTRAESKDLLYIAGEVHGEMTVDVLTGKDEDSTETITTKPNGETDIWVAQLRASDGKVKWVQQIGTDQQDRLAKNSNNPSVSEAQQESNIGETGSGKGALVIDRHGHALVYGTSNGSLIRDKIAGDRNRDIFVLRLHRDDGSYQSILELPATSAPNGDGSSGSTSVASTGKPAMTHAGAAKDGSSINYTIVFLGLAIPAILSTIILIATSGRRPDPMVDPESAEKSDADLVVDFPANGIVAEAESSPRRPAASLHQHAN